MPGIFRSKKFTNTPEYMEETMSTEENNVYLETGFDWADGWYDMDDIFAHNGDIQDHIVEQLGLDSGSDQAADLVGADFLVVDYEGPIATAFAGRYSTFDWSEAQQAYDWWLENQHYDQHAIRIFVEYEGAWDRSRFEDAYCGDFSDSSEPMEEYAQDTFESCYDIPEHLQNYIDWSAVARDMSVDHHEEDGHVFRQI